MLPNKIRAEVVTNYPKCICGKTIQYNIVLGTRLKKNRKQGDNQGREGGGVSA